MIAGRMDLGKANFECAVRERHPGDRCGPCGMQVLKHCSSCNLQITGCVCTARERNGYEAAVAQFGKERVDRAIVRQGQAEELAKEDAVRSGLWVPGRG